MKFADADLHIDIFNFFNLYKYNRKKYFKKCYTTFTIRYDLRYYLKYIAILIVI